MKTYYNKALLIIFLLTIFSSCKNNTKKDKDINAAQVKLDSIFQNLHLKNDFNGNVLIAKNHKIIYEESFGFTSGNRKQQLTMSDKFNIGSIYKEIPAIAIMQLQEEGKLKLSDYLGEYVKKLPRWSNKITINHLLKYISGLPKVSWGKHKNVSNEALITDLKEISTLENQPGQNYLYSNYSPFLLSKIVENISGLDFPTYVSRNILMPLNLKDSTFNKQFPYKNNNQMAVSFNNEFIDDKPPFVISAPMFLFSTTTKDLFLLLKNLHLNKIISKESLITISKNADLDLNGMESALGEMIFKDGKIVSHTHHGSSGNYEAIVSHRASNNITVILLTNNKGNSIHDINESIHELFPY